MSITTTLLSNDPWAPENKDDETLKTLLTDVLMSTPSSAITKAPDNTTNRFLLQTEGYHDIYQYVVCGITLTDSEEEFNVAFPVSTFAKVNDIDRGAYLLLRESTVSVAQHCSEFNNNGLRRLKTSAIGAIEFADHCISLLNESPDMSLQRNLLVILDEKYRTGPKDTAYEEAVKLAQMAVQSMSDVAKAKANDAANTATLLASFYTQTESDVKNVQIIQEKYLDGPMDPVTGKRKLKADGQPQEPYSDVLSSEITRLQKELQDSVASRDEADDRWRAAKDKAAALGVAGAFIPWCNIGTGIEAQKAMNAKADYQKMVDRITKDNKEEEVLVKVLELVRALVSNLESLLPKMRQVIKAVAELEILFSKQHVNFETLLNNFAKLSSDKSGKCLSARKLWISSTIDKSIEILEEIKLLGLEFDRGATPEIVK